jgi:hypothetical protein
MKGDCDRQNTSEAGAGTGDQRDPKMALGKVPVLARTVVLVAQYQKLSSTATNRPIFAQRKANHFSVGH